MEARFKHAISNSDAYILDHSTAFLQNGSVGCIWQCASHFTSLTFFSFLKNNRILGSVLECRAQFWPHCLLHSLCSPSMGQWWRLCPPVHWTADAPVLSGGMEQLPLRAPPQQLPLRAHHPARKGLSLSGEGWRKEEGLPIAQNKRSLRGCSGSATFGRPPGGFGGKGKLPCTEITLKSSDPGQFPCSFFVSSLRIWGPIRSCSALEPAQGCALNDCAPGDLTRTSSEATAVCFTLR